VTHEVYFSRGIRTERVEKSLKTYSEDTATRIKISEETTRRLKEEALPLQTPKKEKPTYG